MATWPKDERALRDLSPAQHVARIQEVQKWIDANPTRRLETHGLDYYHALTPREYDVLIGNVPWPKDWPKE